jgi:tripartite-type tricarboxylate transporter receptor subunit TctC
MFLIDPLVPARDARKKRPMNPPCFLSRCIGRVATVYRFSWLAPVLVIGCLASNIQSAEAADYPVRPVRLVVVASGGAADILARLIGGHLSNVWGQQVVVDPRPGGSGVVAAQIVARAAPDGYTLLFTFHGHTLSAARGEKLTYDPVKDFAPITQIGASGSILTIHAESPVRSLSEFIAWTRTKKENLNVGVPGLASGGYLAASTYNRMAGVSAVLINHAGSAPALIGVVGRQYDYAFSSVASAMAFIRNGQLRAVAVTLPKRTKVLPEVPALAEALPGFDVSGWWGVLAPANVPGAIIGKLHSEIVKALSTPKLERAIEADGTEIVGSSPEEFRVFLQRDVENWKKAVGSGRQAAK